MPLEIIRQDITKVRADAIVNDANSTLQRSGGVCGAIFEAAGSVRLQHACDKIGYCDIGQAVITPGFDLPARYIIHTVAPKWLDGQHGESDLLANCYTSALMLAKRHNLKSVAFSLITSGVNDYPKGKAQQAAIAAISQFLLQQDMMVFLIVQDLHVYRLPDELFLLFRQRIENNHVPKNSQDLIIGAVVKRFAIAPNITSNLEKTVIDTAIKKRKLEDVAQQLDETFSHMLLRLIDEKGLKDVDVYKKANLDRKLFSKIRSNSHYHVSRQTALALAIALELNLDETQDLIRKAGYALSQSSISDFIIVQYINECNFNIFEINATLFDYDQKQLGA